MNINLALLLMDVDRESLINFKYKIKIYAYQ